MKLHLDRFEGLNSFTGYGADYVSINGRQHHQSVVVFPETLIDPWPVVRVADLASGSLDFLAAHPLEIALIGTGERHEFVHPRLYAALSAARIGVEVMTTAAACRTYNILLAEGRKVAAALVVGPRPAEPPEAP